LIVRRIRAASLKAGTTTDKTGGGIKVLRVAPGQFLDFNHASSYTCRAYVGARRGRSSSIGFIRPLIERSRSA
jgi:hypothetical protein